MQMTVRLFKAELFFSAFPVFLYFSANVIGERKKNDAGILTAGNILHLWEHMSTVNPNMSLSILIYAAESFQKYLSETEQDIYARKPVHIPAPQCFELYSGREAREEGLEEGRTGGKDEGRNEERAGAVRQVYSFLLSGSAAPEDAVSRTAEIPGIQSAEITAFLQKP